MRMLESIARINQRQALFDGESACVLMVSGGSDSTALAYAAAELRDAGLIGPLAMLHVNHQLRGEEAEEDARFVAALARSLDMPLFLCEIDIRGEAARRGENIEAVARRERYSAANEALSSHCLHTQTPLKDGRILTAHTADDRIESFYMRSLVGTGPGGFRSMLYRNGSVIRPLLDLTRTDLRSFIEERDKEGRAVHDPRGDLWREDATNAHTDRFRAYVRHRMVPVAQEWSPSFEDNLVRTMNLIADEDDMVAAMAEEVMVEDAVPLAIADAADEDGALKHGGPRSIGDYADGFLLEPPFGSAYVPLQRRVVHALLKEMLGQEERIDAATVEAVLDGFDADTQLPRSGYVTNIQGNLAVSANKRGVRVEPMAAFRTRRNRT